MLTNPSPKLTNLPEAGDEEEEDEGPATAGPVVIPRILAPRVLNFASDPHVDYDRIVELDYSVLEGGMDTAFKQPTGVSLCICNGVCGDFCHNRSTNIECCGEGLAALQLEGPGQNDASVGESWDESSSTSASSSSHPSTGGHDNCNVGVGCTNRFFDEVVQRPTLRVVFSGNQQMGFCLRAGLVPIPAGAFIIEYVGQVVTRQQMYDRMALQRANQPNDDGFFGMELSRGLYVDAKDFGNDSRFANHECLPSCEVRLITVGGYDRLGVFALRDLEAGAPITYDYNWCSDDKEIVCRCRSNQCRGFLHKANGRK